ncbi:NAD-dependent epimerase/dehydratase family protein [bacterium]|nr:NAD-dependent epimerase/dehydratase family protein [bacterium]
MAKIFITGATGHLGANLAKRLISDGHCLNILFREKSYHPFLENLKFTKIVGDLDAPESLSRGMKDCDYVFHVAGFVSYSKWDNEKLFRINVDGTRNVMEAAVKNKIKKVVITSSTAAIGISKTDELLTEENQFNEKYKKIGYMSTKKQAEELALSYKDKLEVTVLSPTTFFGAGDIKMNTGNLVKAIKNNKIPFAPRGGNSVVNVEDVVNGHILSLEKGENGERYILSNENLSHYELMNIIADVLESKKINSVMSLVLLPVSYCVAYFAENILHNKAFTPQVIMFSSKNRFFSALKARVKLGWVPKVSMKQSIFDAVNFYKEYNLI